jgi:hypothetical protein
MLLAWVMPQVSAVMARDHVASINTWRLESENRPRQALWVGMVKFVKFDFHKALSFSVK